MTYSEEATNFRYRRICREWKIFVHVLYMIQAFISFILDAFLFGMTWLSQFCKLWVTVYAIQKTVELVKIIAELHRGMIFDWCGFGSAHSKWDLSCEERWCSCAFVNREKFQFWIYYQLSQRDIRLAWWLILGKSG